MNKIFLTKRFGFSLAEALITLLIVCIITLASVPVLTKKKRKMSDAPHGQWTCEYNEAGKHISYSQDAPTPVEGDYCEFVPPARATNFTIQAVGGGGAKGSSGAESEEIWGKGGKGAPGAVIIEW